MAVKIKILIIGLLFIIACGFLIEYAVKEIDKKIDWNEVLVEEENEDLGEGFLVERVIDGDTIKLSDGKVVRYIGINAMEMNSKDSETYELAKRATDRNIELVEGKKVILEKDVSEFDKYGRLLRYVYVGDKMVNQILLEEGLVQVATFPPDIKYKELFLSVQKKAIEEKVGLWGL